MQWFLTFVRQKMPNERWRVGQKAKPKAGDGQKAVPGRGNHFLGNPDSHFKAGKD